jgi:ATP-dependent DNA helicase RecQ
MLRPYTMSKWHFSTITYNVKQRDNILSQVCAVIDSYESESGIIYCIKRADVDDLCSKLSQKGYKVLPYHAGMSDEDRKKNQDAFIKDEVDIIVATVAFGMGIDKSNVRYIIHAGMPKSLEHYQQETGRAGRDGLEAECYMFYSISDLMTWQYILRDMDPKANEIALSKLKDMYEFCVAYNCRHKTILSYFGQEYDKENCGACDICLNKEEPLEDSLIIAQKIISCVLRLKIPYGIAYIGRVLLGSKDKRILQAGHDKLSTWGILVGNGRQNIRGWIEQLISQGYLEREGEYSTINVTEKGWCVIKDNETPKLFKQQEEPLEKSKTYIDSWEDADDNLFNALRLLRRKLADEQGVPAFIVFSDVTLRDMAGRKPSTLAEFLRVNGVGQKKCETYGEIFIKTITDYCKSNPVETNTSQVLPDGTLKQADLNSSKQRAFELFAQNYLVENIVQMTGRANSTVIGYLEEYINKNKITCPSPWVDNETFLKIIDAVGKIGTDKLKLIFDYFDGQVSYDQIRISAACLINILSFRLKQ